MKNLLLTGKPGVGKTTLIKKILDECPLRAGGFYTQEIRENNTRSGFEIITLSGQKGILAHVEFKGRHRVGKYRVNLAGIDQLAVKSILDALEQDEIVVIDEIGKMELFSSKFQEAVKEAIDSKKPVLGTIGKKLTHNFAKKIKTRPDIKIIVLNRQQKIDQLFSHLKTIYDISK